MRNEKGQFIEGNIAPNGFKKGHKFYNGGEKGWFKKGIMALNKNIPHSEATKEKQRQAKLKNPTRYWFGKKRTDMIGDKHWNYKGGITPLMCKIRNCFEYRQWRSDIFKRDYWTCVKCGKKKGVKIEADHYPKLFSEIIKEYNIKSLEEAIACQELWDINNGRTLCKSCHQTYGRK